jgi:hypothetical protein
MSNVVPGQCRYCGCTETEPCTQCMALHGECAWFNKERNCCAALGCRRAELARRAANAPAKSKYAGWGYGAIVEDLRKQKKPRRRSRRKAA